MDIHSATYKISITDSEAFDLVFLIHKGLKDSIISHYNHLQQNKDGESIFFDQEKSKLSILKFMSSIIGRHYIYESYIEEYKKLFKDRRDERGDN